MANTNPGELEFMIKLYPGGRFSGLLADGAIKPGDELTVTGPTGFHAAILLPGYRSSAAAPGWRRSSRCCGRCQRRAATASDVLLRRAHRGRPVPPRGAVRPAVRLRPRAVGGQRLVASPASSPTSSTAWRATSRRGRRLRLRPAADGRGGDRPARAPGRAGLLDKFTTTEDERRTPWPRRSRNAASRSRLHGRRGRRPGVPVLAEPQLQLLHAAQAAPTVYEDVTVDVQPDPERHLARAGSTRSRRHRRLSAGVVGAQVVQLARVPRSQRGVGADDLPQQRERRPPDPQNIEHGRTARLRGLNPAWVQILDPRVRVGAREHGLGMHVYARKRDAPTNMINNAMAVGALHKLRFAQDDPHPRPRRSRASTPAPQGDLAGRPGLAADARARRAPDRHPRLVELFDDGGLRAARRRAVPQGS